MMQERWLRSRTPDGNWFNVTWDKPPRLEDIDHLFAVLEVVRDGYKPARTVPEAVFGVRVIHLVNPERAA